MFRVLVKWGRIRLSQAYLSLVQVLVMHDGKRLEYDSVPNLLRMQNGAFRAMVEGAGISHEALNN